MNIKWNARDYEESFSFVPQYGEDVMNLLTVPAGSKVIDLGCGNGTLTKKLAERGFDVTGIDDCAAAGRLLVAGRRQRSGLCQ